MFKLQLPRLCVVTTREKKSVRSPVIASDPISLVAAEIHLGHGPEVITDGWLEFLHSNYVPVQQSLKDRL
jgi:hypothetical protein